MKRRVILYIALPTVLLIAIGYILPEKIVIPVEGATKNDWNHKAFWDEHWGKSKVHKGIDIFTKKGKPVLSSTNGVVIYKGKFSIGGNVIFIL